MVVLDDHSEDRTAAIVEQLIATDERVRLVPTPELPAGWCGKQHACWVLAREACHPLLLFIDADVRLAPDALARMTAFLWLGADLASGIPHQATVGLLEKLLIPLIHFILLGFLPIRRMRRNRQPSFAAGCGQLFIARAQAYHRCGGHSVIRDTLHDGLKLPRAFRVAGLNTDLFDATDLATCRMYRTAGEVWFGLAKNAGEALAAPAMIGPMTAVLLGGQVLPVILLLLGLRSWPEPWPKWQITLALVATIAGPITLAWPRYGAIASLSWEPSSTLWGFSFCWASSGLPCSATPWAAPPPGRDAPLSHSRSTNESAHPARAQGARRRDADPCGMKPTRMAVPQWTERSDKNERTHDRDRGSRFHRRPPRAAVG